MAFLFTMSLMVGATLLAYHVIRASLKVGSWVYDEVKR
jgi:hypothetical protein